MGCSVVNGKLAKKIRRAARERTVGMPDALLDGYDASSGLVQVDHRGKRVPIRNVPATTRALHRSMKRAHRMLKRGGKLK